MGKKTAQGIQEIRINLRTTDAEYLQYLNTGSGGFSLILQLFSKEILTATAMVAIPSGTVTLEDVSRVLDTAMSLQTTNNVILPVSPIVHYEIDDRLSTNIMPVGMQARSLLAKVSVLRVSAQQMMNWHIISNLVDRKMALFDIELLDEPQDR